ALAACSAHRKHPVGTPMRAEPFTPDGARHNGVGRNSMWDQVYNPLNNAALSTIAAAIPVITLLVLIASGKVKAHIAAIIAVVVTNLITIVIFNMPANMSIRASLLGVVAGFFPIGWIVLKVIFLYPVTGKCGKIATVQGGIR